MDDTNNTNPPPPPEGPMDPNLPGAEHPISDMQYEGGQEIGPDENQDELFNRAGPAMSTGPGKVIAFGVIMLVVVGFILYSLFFNKPKPSSAGLEAAGGIEDTSGARLSVPAPPEPPTLNEDVAPAPAPAAPAPMVPPAPPAPPPPPPPPPAPVAETTPAVPVVPETVPGATEAQPSLVNAPPPPPPPLPPSRKPTTPPVPNVKSLSPIASANDKAEQTRLRSNMLVLNSTATTSTEKDAATTAGNALNHGDPNKAFTANVLAASHAEKATATRLNNLNITIAQGKIIDAVLETAINTDLPGTIRAIVSRDVYAETGRDVMIPKGSRLLGTYNTGVTRGQVRVLVVWTRLIRPDGIDIEIGSPGVDALGRAGVEGVADNKYSEIFSAAILTSALDIGVAIILDKTSNQQSTTTTGSNGTTTTGTSAATAGAAGVTSIGSVGKDIVNSLLDLRPTITVDQGTKVDVFVNRDLTFPLPERSFVQ